LFSFSKQQTRSWDPGVLNPRPRSASGGQLKAKCVEMRLGAVLAAWAERPRCVQLTEGVILQ